MYVPDIELHESTSLDEASSLLSQYAPDARVLAGGTDLLVDLKVGRVSVKHLVSVSRVDALRGISATEGGLKIGSLTTITQLDRSPLVKEGFAPLHDATSQMAAQQIRNVATVGGNVVSAVPCADLPPILSVMNASVSLWSATGERAVSLNGFFVGARETVLADGELLTAVLVPAMPIGFGAAYFRFSLREGNAIAVAGAAASLLLDSKGIIQDAQVSLGAVAPTPKLVDAAKAVLVGQRPDEKLFEKAGVEAQIAANPICDVRGSSQFRKDVVAVLTRRALAKALDRAKENQA